MAWRWRGNKPFPEPTSQFPTFCYFTNISDCTKHTLAIEYHIHISQVSPQLTSCEAMEIWMSFNESNRYFCKIQNFAYGEINDRSFINLHPWSQWVNSIRWPLGGLNYLSVFLLNCPMKRDQRASTRAIHQGLGLVVTYLDQFWLSIDRVAPWEGLRRWDRVTHIRQETYHHWFR